MEQTQIDLLLKAAKALQEKKEFYDYMVVVLPIVTAILGWFASIWAQSYIFKKNSRKEHYYTAREKAGDISKSLDGFLSYLYAFYKDIKNILNRSGSVIDDDVFNDFITEYTFRLGSIRQKLRIVFPGKKFPTLQLVDEMTVFEKNIKEMNAIGKEVRESQPDMNIIGKRVKDLNDRNNVVIKNVTKYVVNIEDSYIEILDKRAKELGLTEL